MYVCMYVYICVCICTYVEAGIIRTFKNRVLGVSYRLDLHHKGAKARQMLKPLRREACDPGILNAQILYAGGSKWPQIACNS